MIRLAVATGMLGFCCVGAWFLTDAFASGVMQLKGNDAIRDQEPFRFWFWATIQFVLLLFFGSFAIVLITSAVRDLIKK